LPHLVTQRGNGRDQPFFTDADCALYHHLLATSCRAAGVEVWSWVLMPSHVHLILSPAEADGIRRALAPVHRRYAGAIHTRRRRTGHFWQGRFGAVALDGEHLAAAARYVARSPARAGLREARTGSALVERPGPSRRLCGRDNRPVARA
jgi:putative transposase